MRPITSTQKDNVFSLFHTPASFREISAWTGVSNAKIASMAKELVPDKKNNNVGQLSKLSSTDQHASIKQISTGRAKTSAEVARNSNPLLSQFVSTQTIKNTLHQADIVTRKVQKKLKLTSA